MHIIIFNIFGSWELVFHSAESCHTLFADKSCERPQIGYQNIKPEIKLCVFD